MLVGSMGVNSLRLPTGLVTWERFVSRLRDRGGAMLHSRLVGPRHSEVLEDPVPEPGAGQILVDIEACGVCASELETWATWKGFSPKGLGHEPAGVAREVGEGVTRLGVGDPDEITAGGWKLDQDGMMPIPDAPGLGIEIDHDAVARYSGGRSLLDG
jgi:Alcohol dehydrogenase GroES-like domain